MSKVVNRADFTACTTVEELAHTMAEFCRSTHPDSASASHAAPLMPESDEIRDDLVALNEFGWITTNSQPTSETDTWVQRAAVSLWLPHEESVILLDFLQESDLLYVFETGACFSDGEPDSYDPTDQAEHVTWYSKRDAPIEVEYLFQGCAPEVISALETYYVGVNIADSDRDNPRALWDFLARVRQVVSDFRAAAVEELLEELTGAPALANDE